MTDGDVLGAKAAIGGAMSAVGVKLEEWKRQLLDSSRRNRLLHFRETKRLTLRIDSPQSSYLFEQIAMLERPVQVVGLEPQQALDLDELTYDAKAPALLPEEVGRGEIRFEGDTKRVATALYALRSRARTESEERGVGVLYLAFGFLHWFESSHSEEEAASPLVLVPVDLVKESALKPYRIVLRDDEIILNPTLVAVMKAQFGIDLPELPDADEWKLSEFLQQVKEDIASQSRWRVEPTAYLGVFSFQKLTMYHDLEAGLAIAENCPIIQALAGDPSSLEAVQSSVREVPAEQLDAIVDPATSTQVLDADSSQMQAIELAKAGVSFVLQGPPGTGKSQTITNIIAELLGAGKSVLFVAEKAAALEVVSRRLAETGLADACLSLHSQKASKRDVVAELARVYQLGGGSPLLSPRFNYAQLRERRRALNSYVTELHQTRMPLDRSVYAVQGDLAALSDIQDVSFIVGDISSLTMERLESMADAFSRLSANADTIATLSNNPWREATIDNGDLLSVRQTVEMRLGDALTACEQGRQASEKLVGSLGTKSQASTPAKATALAEAVQMLAGAPRVLGTWLTSGKIDDLIVLEKHAREQHERALAKADLVAVLFSDSVLDYAELDGLSDRLHSQYASLFSRLGRAFRHETRALAAHTLSGKKPKYAALRRVVPDVVAWRDLRRRITADTDVLTESFGQWYDNYATDWSGLEAALQCGRECVTKLDQDALVELARHVDDIQSDRAHYQALAGEVRQRVDEINGTAGDIPDWFDENSPLALMFRPPLGETFQSISAALIRLRDSLDSLADWTRLVRALRACIDTDMANPLSILQNGNLPAEQYAKALRKRVLTLWRDAQVGSSTVLHEFESTVQEQHIDEFRRLDAGLKNAARAMLAARLAEARPRPSNGSANLASSQPTVLMKEAKKKRRHKPLRRLFSEIPDLLPRLKPCLLMSPLSVGEFLTLGSVHFDAVIFDEASQVRPEDAIGAIMRGRQVIVVGDSKQLPPTAFFDSAMSDEFDEENPDDEAGAYESILDQCATIGIPQRMLEWHYRSRREGLIAFSNSRLYDNRLITFPECTGRSADNGVKLCYLDDGVYDRSHSRTNRREAQEVAQMVHQHVLEHPDKTLGVVAFSQAQQEAIEHLLERLRYSEPEFENLLDRPHHEPFFVKSLENVQGDERDVIIFSVGYGKDAYGKMTMQLGPLNRAGGERRLNVAITRAREQVFLVSSIHAYDLRVTPTSPLGIRLLQQYLDYAERGPVALDAIASGTQYAEAESPFEDQVARELEAKGYTVIHQVGCSHYRIDLAIVHPQHPGRYVLGIECDGASYHSAATARERDRLREEVLKQLGWKLYRVWSTDWFRDRSRARAKLFEAVEVAVRCSSVLEKASESGEMTVQTPLPSEPLPSQTFFASFTLPSTNQERLLRMTLPYAAYWPKAQPDDYYTSRNVMQILLNVVDHEAPIHKTLAARRVASAWDIARVGSRVRAVFELAVQSARRKGLLVQRGEFLYAPGAKDYYVRKNKSGDPERKAEEIAPEEIAVAAKLILQDEVKLTEEDLATAVARAFGFERTGVSVRRAMLKGIEWMVQAGQAVATGDGVMLP